MQFNSAFDDLLAHVAEHFTHEESILLSRSYEKTAEHAEQHQDIVESAMKHSDGTKCRLYGQIAVSKDLRLR